MCNKKFYEILSVKEGDTLKDIFYHCRIFDLKNTQFSNEKEKEILSAFREICKEDERKNKYRELLLDLFFKSYANVSDAKEDIVNRIKNYI